jgi:hypothetical protein
MNSGKIFLYRVAILIAGLAPFGFGQIASQFPGQHPARYYGQTADSAAVLDEEAAAATPTTGTLDLNFTLTVKTAIPKNGVITCLAVASVSDPGTGFGANERSFGTAKLVSGTTYSCALKINYSWRLGAPTKDKIRLDATANMGEGYQITATNGPVIDVVSVIVRGTGQSILTFNVPANGAVTTEAINITL